MKNEKAAIKRSLAREARFREEKQQIVASMRGSPVELLTPYAGPNLQRKLQDNQRKRGSSPGAQDAALDFQANLVPVPRLPEQDAPTRVSAAVFVNDEYPVPLNHNAESAQYREDDEEHRGGEPCTCKNKKVYVLAAVAVLALSIGSAIGILVSALLTRRNNVPSTPNEQCHLDRVALVAQCGNNILAVPDCAEAAYLELTDTYTLGEEEACDSAHMGLVALAVAITNRGGDLVDPITFYAMSTVYFALKGVNWQDESGWLRGSSPCSSEWYGVECSSSGVIRRLELENNRLRGTIPTEIGLLSNLEIFNVDDNAVSGPLPSEMGMLSNLNHVSIQDTLIHSNLPSEIGNLGKLRELWLTRCPLTGTIPSELGNLINLEMLVMDSTRFTGTIPEELGSLVNVKEMVLHGLGGISGSFPPISFASLSNLQQLVIYLPYIEPLSILEDISMATGLKVLIIDMTDLTGSIPTEIGLLSDIVHLCLSYANLQGTLPSEIGLLTKLTRLDVHASSALTGSLPSELGYLTNLQAIDITLTHISGTVPPEVCALNMTWPCTDEGRICESDVIYTCS